MQLQSLWQVPLLLGAAAISVAQATTVAQPVASVAVPGASTAPTGPVDTATLLKQIDDLKKQVAHIAYKQRKADEKLENTTQIEDAKIGVLQANQVSPYPEGYIAIPSTNSAVKIGGRIKADLAYYPGQNGDLSGAEMSVRSLALKGQNPAAGRSGHFNGTVQSSRIELNSLTQTNKGDLKANLLADFYGAQQNAATGNGGSSTNYGFRVRHAYLEWCGLLAGQNETNFFDADLIPDALDNLGGLTYLQRRPQLRYTTGSNGIALSVSIEKGDTDYTSQAATLLDNSNNGKTSVPDLTARLRYEGKMGFVSLSGIIRTLQVNVGIGDTITSSGNPSTNYTSTVDYRNKQTAWGLALSGKLLVSGKSNLYGRASVGDGLGYLIEDASCQAGYLQVPTTQTTSTAGLARYAARFDTNTLSHGILGYEHWWTDQFRTNIGGSYTKIKNSKFAPVLNGSSQINARVKKAIVSAIYSPVKSMDVGIEFMYGVRETISGALDTSSGATPTTAYNGATGRGTQVLTSFIYKF